MTDIVESVQNYWNIYSESAMSQVKLSNKNNTCYNNPNRSRVVSSIDVERCIDVYNLTPDQHLKLTKLLCLFTHKSITCKCTLDSSFSMASLRS